MSAPDYFPPDYTHTLLPIDAQMMLRDAYKRCMHAKECSYAHKRGMRANADTREGIIETAERRVREMCPDAFGEVE